jgi:hypothetical protein
VNDGAGNFAPSAGLNYSFGTSLNSIQAGDIDADGDVDLLLLGDTTPHVLRNSGSGSFTDTTLVDLPLVGVGSISSCLVLADLDDDGDLDLGALRNAPPLCLVLLNDGSGRFSDVSTTRAFLSHPDSFLRILRLRAADVDDDGDVDLIAGIHSRFSTQQTVLTNHLRQCRSNVVPRLGGIADLHLISGPNFGQPGLGVLGVGFAVASTPTLLPGLAGRLELDPATLQVVATVTTSSIGVSSAFVSVPMDGALFGVEVWFQGAILPSLGRPGLTNSVYEVVLR